MRNASIVLGTLAILLAPLAATGCDSAGFGGKSASQGVSPKPPTETRPTTPSKPQATTTTLKDEPSEDLGGDSKPDQPDGPDEPAPPVGPGSELTLTIADRDSKLDQFEVRNAASKAWIPLTWRQGTQTVQGACSPSSKTTLSLHMHSSGGLFTKETTYQPGGCNAPLTQSGPNEVRVGLDPSCGGSPKATFSLTCTGSSGLQVVP